LESEDNAGGHTKNAKSNVCTYSFASTTTSFGPAVKCASADVDTGKMRMRMRIYVLFILQRQAYSLGLKTVRLRLVTVTTHRC